MVSGTAEMTRGEEVILLTENQSTYIPLGVTHRLRKPGKLPLELVDTLELHSRRHGSTYCLGNFPLVMSCSVRDR